MSRLIIQHALCSSLLSTVSFEQWCWVKFPSACADAKASKAVPGQWWRHCKPDNATKRVPGDNDDGCGCGESGQPSDSKLGSYCRAWATLPWGDRATTVPARSWCWTLSYCLRAHVTHSHSCRQPHQPVALVLTQRGRLVPFSTMAPIPVPIPACAVHGTTSLPSMVPTRAITVIDHTSTNRRDRTCVHVPVQRSGSRSGGEVAAARVGVHSHVRGVSCLLLAHVLTRRSVCWAFCNTSKQRHCPW